jgi:hypothetical protein
MLPATKALPFVKLRAEDQPQWHPESYWSVEPTGGRAYAQKAIAAMKADHNKELISLIVRDNIRDAAHRSGRGRLSYLAMGSSTRSTAALQRAVTNDR